MELSVNLTEQKSRIIIERDAMLHLADYIDVNCKVMIITDDGVPERYQKQVLAQCPQGYLHVCRHGEGAKSFPVYKQICEKLLQLNFSRKDRILALGGGVIGDLSGFVAATFKRGMKFASIPTTTLSQIDSSIGGKVAVNLGEVKNVIGTFYHPEVVLIDLNTLRTLPKRHYYNGLVEAVKAGMIADPEIFRLFEEEEIDQALEEIITRSLIVKKHVVEEDEKEQNFRKILNFGHTIGHAIESIYHLHDYYHGECVAMGMMKILEDEQLKERLKSILKKMEIPLDVPYEIQEVIDFIKKDKKASGDQITIVQVREIGKAELIDMKIEDMRKFC
ncbi:3-dehydroquinate synthase [Coprococcus sp. HPP0048]|nr:3-dehydroquinate synthase [Coprococcus sp. HPP0048]